MSSNNKTIVDVRTPEEFSGGNVNGSINIPLQEIQKRLDEIKALRQPIILCCASGNRNFEGMKLPVRCGCHLHNKG